MWPKDKRTPTIPAPTASDTSNPETEDKPDAKPADGGFQSMDQVANWVRFADTKATILTAGLGVVLTMLMTNSNTVVTAINAGCTPAWIVGSLAASSLLAFLWTLYWLVRAIGPQSRVTYAQLNRFAWPTLTKTTAADLATHAQQVDVRDDAWQQVVDLSQLAERKFSACGKAVWGFAFLVVLGLACVAVSVVFTA